MNPFDGFVITSDNTCDMPEEFYLAHDVRLLVLSYTVEGVRYGLGQNMDPKEFYRKMRGGEMPQTQQATPMQAEEFFEGFLRDGKIRRGRRACGRFPLCLHGRGPASFLRSSDEGSGEDPRRNPLLAGRKQASPLPLFHGRRPEPPAPGRKGIQGDGDHWFHARHQANSACG